MYAAEFDYYKAGSVADAIRLLGAHPGSKLIAGGHSLIPLSEVSPIPAYGPGGYWRYRVAEPG